MLMRVQLVMDEFNRHRRQFEHLCRSLAPEELEAVVPGSHWTVRDYIAHLCTIDGLIVPRFAAMVGQEAPLPDTPIPNPFDIDEWNEQAVLSRRGRNIEELLAEAAIHRERLLAAVGEMRTSTKKFSMGATARC
ncbi:MAG: hypothetical protein C4321_07040 [Chloroflexota bacterium]